MKSRGDFHRFEVVAGKGFCRGSVISEDCTYMIKLILFELTVLKNSKNNYLQLYNTISFIFLNHWLI